MTFCFHKTPIKYTYSVYNTSLNILSDSVEDLSFTLPISNVFVTTHSSSQNSLIVFQLNFYGLFHIKCIFFFHSLPIPRIQHCSLEPFHHYFSCHVRMDRLSFITHNITSRFRVKVKNIVLYVNFNDSSIYSK